MQLHDLCTMDQALSAVRHEARLRSAPAGQGRRPLLSPAEIEDVLARLDDRAIDDPGDGGGNLTAGDRDHGLVEPGDTLGLLSQRDQRLSLTELAEGHQVPLAEAGADLGGLARCCVRAGGIALAKVLQSSGDEQIPPLGAIFPAVVEKPLGPGEPAVGGGYVTLQQKREAQPEGAPNRSWCIARAQALAMRTSPHVGAVAVPSGQVGGGGKALKVLRRERCLLVRRPQLGIRIRPRLPLEGLTAQGERAGRSHYPLPTE
jgi:hypothetical protein